jgi:hypothetical protein
MYLSRWPGSMSAALFYGDGAENSFDDDVSAEGRKPTEVAIRNLDETAIKSAMSASKTKPDYSFLFKNCATHVSLCLNAGKSVDLEDIIDGASLLFAPSMLPVLIKRWGLASTPPGVYVQAQKLKGSYG